jgi:hypothetical protein
VFQHELADLEASEIAAGKKDLAKIIELFR